MKRRSREAALAEFDYFDRLTATERKAYHLGFWAGNESHYHPFMPSALSGSELAAYDRGYDDGKQYGPRKGKPWSLPELLKLMAEDKAKEKHRKARR